MRSKRLLTMLLAIVMVLSVCSPAVNAVTAGEDSVLNAGADTSAAKNNASRFDNDLVVDSSESGQKTLRDEEDKLDVYVEEANRVEGDGEWTANEVDKDLSLTMDEVPECLQELQEAAEVFAQDEVVAAFVVMEDEPMSASVDDINDVPQSAENALLATQNTVIEQIEKKLLGGKDLDVRYQFTYLTNSFTINTEFGNLAEIAKMDKVKSVFVMPVFEPATVSEGTADPQTESAGQMTGVAQVWADLGYTGKGMKIAVIDTGLDLDHPSFAADPATNENSMTKDDIAAVLEDLNAYDLRSSITADTLYRSAKVPFAFNYVDASLTADHSADSQGDHGTHVSGIAAANKTEGTNVVGMAPDAQIIVMKVFGANGGAYMDDIAAAMEDAMTLGCDVINASLGSSAGFSSSDSELDLIYERLAAYDIIANFSAGNEGTSSQDNMWGTDMNRTQNPDNAAIGSPATYANVMSIASADNCVIMSDYFTVGENEVFYQESYQAALGYVYPFYYAMGGQELEYVMIDGVGEAEYFYDAEGTSLVEGKVAVVSRGTITYGEKVSNAEAAGAVACIVYNNKDTDDIFGMYMNLDSGDGTYPSIPCAMITQADGIMMGEAETKVLTVATELGSRENVAGGQMSSFSSWGVSPDLRLVPDITGVGGNVYSCYDGGGYGLMSGTSMSSPQVAGVAALVMEYLYEEYPYDVPDGSLREVAEALLMSTADPIVNNSNYHVEASPRQQGAGLVDAYEAVTSEAYLTVGGGRPKAEMGDSSTGTYKFSFEVHNFSDEAKTYDLDATLLTELAAGMKLSETEVEYFMSGEDMPLDGTVTFDKDTVTVAAGEIATVVVTVTLSEDDKAMFEQCWENGGYVEGYVYLTSTDAEGVITEQLNLPFLGFYGDWTEAPVFDTAYWYDNSFWGTGDGIPEGDQYYHIMWTDLGGSDWVLGFNPYSGAMADENGNIVYDPSHNVVSPNGDGLLDGISEIYLSLLRNAKTMTLTYTVDGEIVHREIFTNNRKTMYQSGYGQIVPWLYSWYGMDMYDFTDAEGNTLPSGTEVLLTVDANVDYGTGGDHSIEIPIIVDTQKPELVEVYEIEQDGQYYLVVEASDDQALAAIVVTNPTGTQTYGAAYDGQFQVLDNGNSAAVFNITELGTKFTVAVCDYAANEAYYDVEYKIEGGNLPTMDDTQLYAYRVSDDHIASDHMYGWVSLNKPEADEYANISLWTDDYLEYAAINAAEQVDGKIFGVDAVGNFVVMDPGLWNRQTICNIGANVLDMTFDDSTNTMLMLVKDSDYTTLRSINLLTGEMVELADFGYYSYGPYAIADDGNSTIYAVQYSKSTLYTLDAENGYAMVAVTTLVDDVESDVNITDASGNNIKPNYMQSMTYSDGKLYLAYYYNYYNWTVNSELITIDTADWSIRNSTYAGQAYNSDNEPVDYYPMTELVGLHTLTPTEYQIPEATELSSLLLSQTSAVMLLGGSEKLSASPIPWNYELGELTWTSSNEAVVTVDAQGNVTAVDEGEATVTVASGDVTAVCKIKVVDVETTFNAYNYYSGDNNYGYMIEVDTGSMNYSLVAESPVDFMAGDYNGHDGYFYGYSDGGQFWRYDQTTGEAVKLGEPLGMTPVDMAYDYSTGLMYAITLDYNSGASTLCTVSMSNGKLDEVNLADYSTAFYAMMTVACDTDGNLYTLDSVGNLYIWQTAVVDGQRTITAAGMLMEELGSMNYMQSMCWDHENDVLLWAYCEGATVAWIDPFNGYAISLGDPTGAGMFEFVGMHTVPAEIPELAPVAVESVEASDMMMLVGATKYPNVDIKPYNATNTDLTMTSSDESIVKVNDDGTITGVAEGVATITVELVDGENTFTAEFTVTTMVAADNIYGHVLTDIASGGGQYWVRLYAADPSDPDLLTTFEYTLFAGEYVDGKLYTVGYDPNSWDANWQFFVLDPANNYAIEKQVDLGEIYPFVYDMTYDPATATMYCVASYDNEGSNTDLYVMDIETGAVTLLMQTEPILMSIAAGKDGVLYSMAKSEQIIVGMDEWGWEIYETLDAVLYAVDPVNKTIEEIGSSGIKCNKMASMAYDFDTEKLYWTPLYESGGYVSSLAVVDTETGKAASLGAIGSSGAQVSGLYIVSDNVPEANTDTLQTLIINPVKASLTVGQNTTITVKTIPLNLENAEIVWTSSNENVAAVDENGVVTGMGNGIATITATVTCNGKTMSAECTVSVLAADAAFLTWNKTVNAWAKISRADYTVVELVTEPDENAADVAAIAAVNNTVYGYDVNGQLFILNDDYSRTNIGDGLGLAVEEAYHLEIADMAYDKANQRMLVLGSMQMYDSYWDEYSEIEGGTRLYTLDLTTGELTELYVLQEYNYVKGMSCGTDGTVYFYTTFDDVIRKLDLTTGSTTSLGSLQTQNTYGDGYSSQSMYYDELTDCLYMAFTSNGEAYQMVTCDVSTGDLRVVSFIGDVVYDSENYVYENAAQYAGLVFVADVEEPECDHANTETVNAKDATCTEAGYTGDVVCADCGEVIEAGSEIAATDHNYVGEITTQAGCATEGEMTYTCQNCGDSYTEVIPATGDHTFEDGKCTECGAEDPDYEEPSKPGWSWGDWFGGWFGNWWGDKDEPTETTEAVTTETTEAPTEDPTETVPDDGGNTGGSWWEKFFGSFWPFH